jgi:uncharacterized membrane protein
MAEGTIIGQIMAAAIMAVVITIMVMVMAAAIMAVAVAGYLILICHHCFHLRIHHDHIIRPRPLNHITDHTI